MIKFGLIGAAGYVAPRHMEAINNNNGTLIAALDVCDIVGTLDKYFPNCEFFCQEERFDRHILKLDKEDRPEYITVCSPNYLHESHCKLGLRLGANIICEKPLVLCSHNIPQLKEVESQMGKKVYTILQLRLHPSIKILKAMINKNEYYDIDLKYITSRGPWYFTSWKGNIKRSGGIETNIGIHFFDMLMWLFGDCEKFVLEERDEKHSIGTLYLERAKVKWFLSINKNDLPPNNTNFYRSMKINNFEVRFDNVFSNLHTESYKEIFNGNGFGIDEASQAIELVERIRKA